jgi:hypothetical protein
VVSGAHPTIAANSLHLVVGGGPDVRIRHVTSTARPHRRTELTTSVHYT